MNNNEEAMGNHGGTVLVGLLVIAAGLAMLADRIGISGVHLSGRYWPLFLIAFGLVRLINAASHRNGRPRPRWTGAWFIYLGLWFFVNEFHVFGFDYGTSWPLLIVGAGIGIMWRAIENPGRRHGRQIEENG